MHTVGHLYVNTEGTLYSYKVRPDYVIKSTDGGDTWSDVSNVFPDRVEVHYEIVNPDDADDRVLVSLGQGGEVSLEPHRRLMCTFQATMG